MVFALRILRQVDPESEVALGYIITPCLETPRAGAEASLVGHVSLDS